MKAARLAVHVSGPIACFTRPEFGVERVSYPVMTPPAAVGLLSAVFWKKEFDWRIDEIWVLNDLKWSGMTKNEVKSVAGLGRTLDVTDDRTQRHTLYLADVAYVIHAHIELRSWATAPVAKYQDQFRRRVSRGAHFSVPYLGLQEFHADVRPFDTERHVPRASLTLPVGPMPLTLNHQPDGTIRPDWFDAIIRNGVLEVPTVGAAR